MNPGITLKVAGIHSIICLREASFWLLCKQLLTKQIWELGLVAKETICHSKIERKEESETDGNGHVDENEDSQHSNSVQIPNNVGDLEEIKQTVTDLNWRVSSLILPSQPSQQQSQQGIETIIEKYKQVSSSNASAITSEKQSQLGTATNIQTH